MNATVESISPDLVIFAHELRQPLSSILLATECLNGVLSSESSTHEMCQIIKRQSRFLVRMIEKVLEQLQKSADRLPLCQDWFDLGEAIAGAIEATGALLEERGSRLTVLLPPEQLWLYADPLQVQQILINLLSNASKYSEQGGCIRLAVEVAAGAIVITLDDDGIGIPEALLPRIFNLFERSAEPVHRQIAGLGVGLALVKCLVELHGGTITAYSEGVGKGSTFVVRLPEHAPRTQAPGHYRRTSGSRSSADRDADTDAMCDA